MDIYPSEVNFDQNKLWSSRFMTPKKKKIKCGEVLILTVDFHLI